MKKSFLSLTVFCSLVFLATSSLQAQIRTPQASPSIKVTQTVGLTEVTLEYARPSLRDREAFGPNGIVPYGEMWRTGANAATKISFADDVTVGGNPLSKGSYALLSMPGMENWVFFFYPYESTNWGSYTDKMPAVKVEAKAETVKYSTETFTININNVRNTGATLDFAWGQVMVSLPFAVEVDKRVMADIERVMAGPSANDYFAAATYLHESGKDLKKALEYVQKANAMGDARFWVVRREALILGDLGMYAEAVAAAEKSIKLASDAGNMEYVKMNKASIEAWSSKVKKGGK